MLFLKLSEQVVICHWWTSHSISVIYLRSQSLVCGRFRATSIYFSLRTNVISVYPFSCRGYYIIIVPLKKSRGKFIKPWESPDEMELDEVTVSLLAVSFTSYLIYRTPSAPLQRLWAPSPVAELCTAGWSAGWWDSAALWVCWPLGIATKSLLL